MYKSSVFSLLILFINPIQSQTISNKINVEVLYESLCPDSHRFIKQQLYPAWSDLAPYVNLILTPFGKSASSGNEEFQCQHGPLECKGNRIMSCVLYYITNQSSQVEYVNCFMEVFKRGHRNPEEFGQRCANAVGLNLDDFSKCYSSQLGTQLQLAAENRTFNVITPSFIPSILYHNQFNQDLQDNSLKNFKSVACNIIRKIHSNACRTQSILNL